MRNDQEMAVSSGRPGGAALADQLSKLQGRSRLLFWVLAARVKTLGLSITPVVAGTWLAAEQGHWRPAVFAAALVAAMLIQLGTNLWNDAADAASGVDGDARLGPPRMTALGLLPAQAVRAAALAAFTGAAGLGFWLTLVGGWPILVLGVISLALGFCYSMGPYPLSATPLGEVLVIGFFGVAAVAGTAYLHGAEVSAGALRLGVILGLPAAAVLLLNNHRDRDGDARAGRRTLAILVGPRVARGLYGALILSAVVAAMLQSQAALTLLPAAGLAGWLCLSVARTPVSPALNPLIGRTALFQAALLAGVALA